MTSFGTVLKQWRKLNKLTQTEAAEIWGISQSHISSIEAGRRRMLGQIWAAISSDRRYGPKYRKKEGRPEWVKKRISAGRKRQLEAKWQAKAAAELAAVRAKHPVVQLPRRKVAEDEGVRGYLRERSVR